MDIIPYEHACDREYPVPDQSTRTGSRHGPGEVHPTASGDQDQKGSDTGYEPAAHENHRSVFPEELFRSIDPSGIQFPKEVASLQSGAGRSAYVKENGCTDQTAGEAGQHHPYERESANPCPAADHYEEDVSGKWREYGLDECNACEQRTRPDSW